MKQVKLLLSFFSDFCPIINANLIFLSRESRLLRSKIILFILYHLLLNKNLFTDELHKQARIDYINAKKILHAVIYDIVLLLESILTT